MSQRRDFRRRVHHNDWQQRRYQNPFETPKKSRLKIHPVWWIGTGIVIFLFLLFLAPWWRFQSVQIDAISAQRDGVQAFTQEALSRKTLLFFPRNHKLFFSKRQLANDIQSTFFVERVQVQDQGNILVISFADLAPSFVFEVGESRFFVDPTGVLVAAEEEAPEQEPSSNLFTLRFTQPSTKTVGERILPEEEVLKLTELGHTISESPLRVEAFVLDDDEERFLKIYFESGFVAYFNPSRSYMEQWDQLQTVIQEENRGLDSYEYIDVRFGERVYVKDR